MLGAELADRFETLQGALESLGGEDLVEPVEREPVLLAERKLAQIGIEEVLKQLIELLVVELIRGELLIGQLAGGRWLDGQGEIWYGVCLHTDSVADSRDGARGMGGMSVSLRSMVVNGGRKVRGGQWAIGNGQWGAAEGDAPRRARRAQRGGGGEGRGVAVGTGRG